MDRDISLHFTGHRPKLMRGRSIYDNIDLLNITRDILINHIENKGVTRFISGMAIGFDMWAAKVVIKLKDRYPHIKLVLAIPCSNQYKYWSISEKDDYYTIMKLADEVNFISKEEYFNGCMQKRDKWMADNAKYTIAAWNGDKSGTSKTIEYALANENDIVTIHPLTLEIRKL